jgi:hypothetical protein
MINRDLPVYILSSVTGLKRWVDYIPVKSGAYAGRDDSFDEEGCLTPAALSSTTGLTAWVDYVPVFEVSDADEFRWSFDDRGFYPVEYSSGGEVAWTPLELFAASEVGAWYDPSDMGTMYQESTGRTPITAVEQAVGLILDMAQGAVRGSELLTNGDFSSGETGWTFNNFTGAPDEYHEVVDGRLHIVVTNTTGCSSGQAVLTVGKWYEIIVTGEKISGDNISFRLGNTNTGSVTSSGSFTYSALAQCTVGTSFTIQNNSNLNAEFYLDSVSVKEVPGNHAFQATTAQKPTLRARYNQLTYSEQFDNAIWDKSTVTTVTANATTAPDGALTADKLVETATSNNHFVRRAGGGVVTTIVGQTYVMSVYLKAAERSWASMSLNGAARSWFDLSTGALGTTDVLNTTHTIEAVGNGWYKCTIAQAAVGASFTPYVYVNTADAQATYVGDGTSGIYVWGADTRPGTSIDTYQRIAATTDYDTVGFLPYLAFDGVDDNVATAAVDFTATDEMSVFMGAMKLRDTSIGVVVELGPTVANPNSFALYYPQTGGQPNYGFYLNGSGLAGAAATNTIPYAAPHRSVASVNFDIAQATSAAEILPRVNGAIPSSIVYSGSASAGTGNFGNLALAVGRRATGSLPFQGNIYSLIVRGVTSTAGEIDDAEAYVAEKTGVTL